MPAQELISSEELSDLTEARRYIKKGLKKLARARRILNQLESTAEIEIGYDDAAAYFEAFVPSAIQVTHVEVGAETEWISEWNPERGRIRELRVTFANISNRDLTSSAFLSRNVSDPVQEPHPWHSTAQPDLIIPRDGCDTARFRIPANLGPMVRFQIELSPNVGPDLTFSFILSQGQVVTTNNRVMVTVPER